MKKTFIEPIDVVNEPFNPNSPIPYADVTLKNLELVNEALKEANIKMTVLEMVKDKIRWHRDFLLSPAKVVIVDPATYIQLLRDQHRDVGPSDKLQILDVDVVRSMDVKGFKIY